MAKNSMQHFRARKQRSGKTFYYFDTGGTPRKEIPLGSDYVLAVRKWAELKAMDEAQAQVATFIDLADAYERDHLPTKADSSQATDRSDLKHLRKFFGEPTPAPLNAITPRHIRLLLDSKKDQPTTANRLKRLFSSMFNKAREWGYTEKENPAAGVRGFSLGKREVYITDAVFKAVWSEASVIVQDAMDLAYLTGQRPGDVLKMTERDLIDGYLVIKRQSKTGRALRIRIEGQLELLLDRITARKDGYKVWSANLTVNTRGMPLTKETLRGAFALARKQAIAKHPNLAAEISEMWFYDLRAKAADDTADDLGEQAAADLLGHDSVNTTKRHYLRRGKKVGPAR